MHMLDTTRPKQDLPKLSAQHSQVSKKGRWYILVTKTATWSFREVDQPLVEMLTIRTLPAFRFEGVAIFEYFFAPVDKMTAHFDHALQSGLVTRQGFKK